MILEYLCCAHRRREELVAGRSPLSDDLFLAEVDAVGPGDLVIAARAAIARMCRIDRELLLPGDDLRLLNSIMRSGLQLGWDCILFVVMLEDALGVTICGEHELPHFVPDRSSPYSRLGEWIRGAVPVLVAHITRRER